LGVAPVELALDGLKESGKSEEGNTAHIEIDDET